jgi:hypothetical protein
MLKKANKIAVKMPSQKVEYLRFSGKLKTEAPPA